MNSKKSVMFSRLSKIQRSLINSLERNLWEAKPKLKLYASKLNIPEYISETAWRIYTEIAKKKLTMGRTIDGFVAASLYAAIRIHEFPKLLEDVSD
ncbi:MAG: transcription initiation factor IIB, partial [Promethearchaeota archaeon]